MFTTTSSPKELSPADFVQLAHDVQTNRYFILASYTIMFWDHFYTLEDEVKLVWKRPKGLVTYLFLINRYLVPCIVTVHIYDNFTESTNTDEFCKVWYMADGFLHALTFTITNAVVALRVSALWGHRRRMNWVIALLWATQFSATCAVAGVIMFSTQGLDYYDTNFKFCNGVVSDIFFWTCVPALIAESILFALTVARGFLDYSRHKTLPIAQILYRDGVVYYFAIVLCLSFNIIGWTAMPRNFVSLSKYSTQAIMSMMGAKLVLNLRRFANRDEIFTEARNTYEMNDTNHSWAANAANQTLWSADVRRKSYATGAGEQNARSHPFPLVQKSEGPRPVEIRVAIDIETGSEDDVFFASDRDKSDAVV